MSKQHSSVIVVINPASATGKRGAIGSRISDSLTANGYAVTVLLEKDAQALARTLREAVARAVGALDAARHRPVAVIAVGGDGLVNLVVSCIVGTDIPLGIIPTGTGNDFARGLGISRDVDEALSDVLVRLGDESLRGGRLVDTAVASCGEDEHPFVGALSAGFDAAVNRRANLMTWPRGSARYVRAVIEELVRLRPVQYRLLVDGEEVSTTGMLVSVANNGSIGGGMKIVPDARLDDGLLDLFVVAGVSRRRFMRLFPRVFRGTHVGIPEVTIRRAREVTVDTVLREVGGTASFPCSSGMADRSTRVIAFADGEEVGPLPVRVRVVPDSLRVLA